MGVFNWLEVNTGLPEELQDLEWQTKSIEPNLMDQCKISDTGYLLRQITILVVDDNTSMGLKAEPQKWVHLCNFNGKLNMIGEIEEGEWVRYGAEFTNGQLDEMMELN